MILWKELGTRIQKPGVPGSLLAGGPCSRACPSGGLYYLAYKMRQLGRLGGKTGSASLWFHT